MKSLYTIARSLWARALAFPGLGNILVGLGIYALEQLITYLKTHPKPVYDSYVSPCEYIEMGV